MAEPSSHKKRAVNEAEEWSKIRSALVVARMEGFCPASNQCSFCRSSEVPEVIWCPDCGPNTLYCMTCNENIHRVVMYHQSYVWKNDVSMLVPLIRDTTLIHEHSCDSIYSRQISVFDSLGRQHKVKSHFCQCEPEVDTLVRRGLWPATSKQPETAFAITLMELCRTLKHEGQLSLQKFCFALEGRTTFLPPHTTDFKSLYLALGNALTEFLHYKGGAPRLQKQEDCVRKRVHMKI
ncbi:uncharacterized protein LOC112566344 isoform X2 [Pomacea canaliculata]|nr:uncharacterized protein LOC112566344 isoform X2 [Pomacea canaliculata]XP_025098272.1 uncharacterized protein LOC112566344 isoform X2 [Pomacea canaliculata]